MVRIVLTGLATALVLACGGPTQPPAATAPGAPTSVTATAGNAQASVSWTAPGSDGGSAITGYTVTASPGGAKATVSAPATTATVTGLANGGHYTFTVVATNAVGSSAASTASTAVTPATVPGAPSEVNAIRGNGQASVSWSTPGSDGGSAILHYTVTASPGGATVTVDFPATSATITGLSNGTGYTFTVVATNALGDGATSTASPEVIPSAATIPGSPSNVTAVAGNTQATVSWTAPTDNGGSALLRYTVTSTPAGASATVTAPATTATLTALTNGTSYTFAVVAINAQGTSAPASTPNAVIPAAPPGAPTGVSATAGNAQATVSWTAPASDGGSAITGFTVTCSPGGLTATASAGTTSAIVSGLTNGTSYTFTVLATNAIGNGAASAPSSAVVPRTVPDSPTGASATTGTYAGAATVSWTPPTSNGGSAITGYTVTASPGGATGTTTGASTAVNVYGLTRQPYTFTVVATNAAGNSAPSAPTNSVTPVVAAGAPTGVTATAGDEQATVSWTAPADDGGSPILDYTVTAIPGYTTTTVSAGTTTATMTGLTHQSYQFAVQARTSVGYGNPGYSNAVTPKSKPLAPTGVTAVAGTAQVDVSWTAPTDNGGYAITGYTVTASPGGATSTVTGTSTTITGLTNDTAYTFTVVATNSLGDSPPSAGATATPFGPPDQAASSVTAAPSKAFANGLSPLALRIVIKDAAGIPVRGQALTLTSSEATDAFSATSGTTSALGTLSATVTGTVAGARTFTVAVGSAFNLTASGTFIAPCTTPGFADAGTPIAAGSYPYWETTGDFDSDGKQDILTASQYASSVTVLGGKGDGTFKAPVTLAVSQGTAAAVSGDFSGDGKLDLALANVQTYSASVALLRGTGAGSFGAAEVTQISASFNTGIAITSGDFNGDGVGDVAVVIGGYFGGTLQAFLGTKNGLVAATAGSISGSGATGMSTGDFDKDGKVDLAVINGAQIQIYLGNGDGTFNVSPLNSTAAGAAPVAADFNKDGSLDLAMTSGNNARIFIGGGNGSFAVGVDYALGASTTPVGMQSADLDGNGALDLATANSAGNSAGVLLGVGDGSFTTPALAYPTAAAAPYSVRIADFNGDGKPDLAFTHPGTSSVSILLNTCQ